MVFILIVLFSSCESDDESNFMAGDQLRITIITSVGGLGDMGYNDLIMAGIMRFYEANEVRMNLLRPSSGEDAERAVLKWIADTRGRDKSLLVLAGNDYEGLVTAGDFCIAENQRILLFESRRQDLPEGVSTFRICRYGASYLAGRMAGEHEAATVVAAMAGDDVLSEAIHGFTDGYGAHSGKRAEVVYLSDNAEGFAMADSAYRVASGIRNAFVFPLAGGSNSGVYKYSREADFYLPLIVGMDTDCSMRSDRIPFSMVVHIDKVVERYLRDWLNDVPLPKHRAFGLESGMIGFAFSPTFYANMDVWEDYYADEGYWEKAYKCHWAEAIRKEGEYEGD